MAADAGGWIEHPLYGLQLGFPRNDGTGDIWTYNVDLGWYYTNENHDWVYMPDAKTWMYPVQDQESGALWFWANENGNSTKGEWFFPNLDNELSSEMKLWDANDKTWRLASEIAGFQADPETGLGIEQDKVIKKKQELQAAQASIRDKYQADLGRDADDEGLAYWTELYTDADGWTEADESAWQTGVATELQANEMENLPNLNPGENDELETLPNNNPEAGNEITYLANTEDLGSGWHMDARGAHWEKEGSNWVFRAGGDGALNGWYYDEPNSHWTWNEDTGWLWHDPSKSGNWYYSNKISDFVYARENENHVTSFQNRDGSWQTWENTGNDGGNANSNDGTPPSAEGRTGPEPGTNIPTRISYDDGGNYYDPEGYLASQRAKPNDLARDLSYEGYDQGLIMKLIKGTEVYKDMMDWATGREDQVAVEGLIDDMVEQVAEVNARKGNIATNLDMFDARGGAMLDPRMTLEEKLAIRTAKPSRPATQADVDAGLAEQVGQIIRNPDYDPSLSYYFEYRQS